MHAPTSCDPRIAVNTEVGERSSSFYSHHLRQLNDHNIYRRYIDVDRHKIVMINNVTTIKFAFNLTYTAMILIQYLNIYLSLLLPGSSVPHPLIAFLYKTHDTFDKTNFPTCNLGFPI